MTMTSDAPASNRPVTSPPRRNVNTVRRISIVVVLIIGLISAGILRGVAADYQARAAGLRGVATQRSTLGNMNSYALALLLGGLRGPLVMFLWTTSESQKIDRDLEDLDTKIEWIRLLQPEFDTVHLFQIWNKAYNISVMMASPANKYTAIMEAIDYGERVDQERPGDLNILEAMGSVYQGKLAALNLPEGAFYVRQFREESMTDKNRKLEFAEDARTFHRLSNKPPLLDDDNNLLPSVTTPRRPKPSGEIPGGEWNDGSDLQYLAPYKQFPSGIPPQAMAFNYNKRAQVAQTAEGQAPLQLSPMVIDSAPAVSMKGWAEEQRRIAREEEAKAFGLPFDAKDVDQSLAKITPSQKPDDQRAMDNALYDYDLTVRLCDGANREYQRHLLNPTYADRINVYQSHLADLALLKFNSSADRDFLAASGATGEKRTALLKAAREQYEKAIVEAEKTVLQFFTEGEVYRDPSFPQPVFQRLIQNKLEDNEIEATFTLAMSLVQKLKLAEHTDVRSDYLQLISRSRERIKSIDQALKP